MIRAYARSDPATSLHTVVAMIDPDADRPVYKQLADLVRGQIERTDLRPGQRIPAEQFYVAEYGISRDSVRRAMASLRNEGLIITTPRGSRVRPERHLAEVIITPGTLVTARMPTEPERRLLAIKEGVPVLVVQRDQGDPELFPADRTAIRATGE
jgi:DNA-binding GntR family transcriptional regulator